MLPTCRIFRNGGRGTPFSRSSRSGGLWRWPKSPKLCSLFPGNLKIFMCFRFLRKKNCTRTHLATGRWCSKLQARLCVEKLCLCLVHRWSFIVCANFSCVLEWKISKLSMRHSNTDFFRRGFPFTEKDNFEIIAFADKPCSPSFPSTREAHGSIGFAIDTSSWVKFHKTRIFQRGEQGPKGWTRIFKNDIFLTNLFNFLGQLLLETVVVYRSLFSSMSAEGRTVVEKMISKLVESGTEIPQWVLTSFSNRAKLRARTSDPEQLKKNLRKLRYRFGGSLAEPAYAGAIPLI